MNKKVEKEYLECNLEKHECLNCGNQFIVGTEMLGEKSPSCPYCGSGSAEKVAWTDSDKLKELDLGCLSLLKEKETFSEVYRLYFEEARTLNDMLVCSTRYLHGELADISNEISERICGEIEKLYDKYHVELNQRCLEETGHSVDDFKYFYAKFQD